MRYLDKLRELVTEESKKRMGLEGYMEFLEEADKVSNLLSDDIRKQVIMLMPVIVLSLAEMKENDDELDFHIALSQVIRATCSTIIQWLIVNKKITLKEKGEKHD